MSEPTKDSRSKDSTYRVKGTTVHAYVDEAGEFRWVPGVCTDEGSMKMTMDVVRKMPRDRRDVWGTRLDREETIARCPVIRSKIELSKEFDEFCAAYDKNLLKPKQIAQQQQRQGGENANE